MFILNTPNSSSISRLLYDEAKKELEVTFKRDSSVYTYSDVGFKLFKHLFSSKSKGRFFNEFIKPFYKGKFVRVAQPLAHVSDSDAT